MSSERLKWEDVCALSEPCAQALELIPRVNNDYVAASAELRNAVHEPRVVFVESSHAKRERLFDSYGFGASYAFDDSRMVPVEDVVAIKESPQRLPVDIERMMYAHGPTHAAGYLVRFVTGKGAEFWHASDELPWFVATPEGVIARDIVDVRFPDPSEYDGVWEREHIFSQPKGKWCLYSSETRH